jgi:MFS family permease
MNIHTFRAFQSRNYRLFFAGQSVSLMGTWMQRTAVYWVIYMQTHSAFILGLSVFASQFPSFLLSLLGGAIADRYDRFKVLLFTQFASMLQATKTDVTSSTIGTALTAASNGDTLLLAGGTYSTDIKFQNGKIITLKSAGTGTVTFNAAITGNATTDTGCGLILEGITINRNNSLQLFLRFSGCHNGCRFDQ